MITTNDIGSRLLDRSFNRTVTLITIDTWNGVEMACVFDPMMPNPANIPGLSNYWVRVSSLTPVEGN